MIGYVTLEEAKEYLNSRYSDVITDEVLQRNLQLAFDKIESIDIRNQGNPKKFPRLCETEVPQLVIQAQILEAYTMSVNPNKSKEVSDNVKSKSIGDYSVSYSDYKVNGVEFYNKTSFDIMNKYRRKSY